MIQHTEYTKHFIKTNSAEKLKIGNKLDIFFYLFSILLKRLNRQIHHFENDKIKYFLQHHLYIYIVYNIR